MANTFTTNYAVVKSEIGANNDNWGTDLNNGLSTIDSQLVRKIDREELKTQTTTTLSFNTSTISSSNTTIFQNYRAGDIISISGANNSDNDGNHTISSKTNAYTLVTTSTFVTENAGLPSTTISYHMVPEFDEINIDGGTIDGVAINASTIENTTVGATTANTGKFTTLQSTGNTTLGDASSDEVTINGAVKLGEDVTVTFEGATANDYETTLTVTDPTADRTVTLPDATDTLVGKTTTDTLENKTLNSSTNTIHADQLRTVRTINVTGGATGSVNTDFSGTTTLNLTVNGLVKFKQTIQSTTLPSGATASASGKVLVAFGYVNNSGSSSSTSGGSNTSNPGMGYGYGYGYGYGQAIATRTYGGSWDSGGNPSGTINWQYCVEMDEVS